MLEANQKLKSSFLNESSGDMFIGFVLSQLFIFSI
jgi:hypothetical protein